MLFILWGMERGFLIHIFFSNSTSIIQSVNLNLGQLRVDLLKKVPALRLIKQSLLKPMQKFKSFERINRRGGNQGIVSHKTKLLLFVLTCRRPYIFLFCFDICIITQLKLMFKSAHNKVKIRY